jgi:hypothetical protein
LIRSWSQFPLRAEGIAINQSNAIAADCSFMKDLLEDPVWGAGSSWDTPRADRGDRLHRAGYRRQLAMRLDG